MPQIIVQNSDSSQLIIDGSGNPGKNSTIERHGFYGDSLDGGDGENSNDITLSLSRNEEKNIIEIDVLGVGSYTLPPYGKIIVKANGGSGGNGGDGGNGRQGVRGADGWDASEYSYSGNGETGGAGTNGGRGGYGGNGGKAGNVTIKVKQKDSDLAQLVDIEMKGGDGGRGGRGGKGGLGGPGGQGGHGCSWTEVSWYGSERHSYTHSNMSGSNGSVGAPGLPGQPGEEGKRGDYGTLNVDVEKDIEPAITITELPQEAPREQLEDFNFSRPGDDYNPSITSYDPSTYSNPFISYYDPSTLYSNPSIISYDPSTTTAQPVSPICTYVPPTEMQLPAIEPTTESTVVDHKRPNRISQERLVQLNNLLSACGYFESKNGTFRKDIEPVIAQPEEAPRELSAIEPITNSAVADQKRPINRISDDRLVLFNNLLFSKTQPESKEKPKFISSIKLTTFKNLLSIPKEQEFKTPPTSKLALEMPACTYDPPKLLEPMIQAEDKIPQQKSSSLGRSIIDSLNKDMARYLLSNGIKKLSNVNSEEYKRKLFTDECKLSISQANNDPKRIKIALELLKSKIIKLKAHYAWGSFFSPNSVKKIDELLNRSELQKVVSDETNDASAKKLNAKLWKQIDDAEDYLLTGSPSP